MTDSDTPLTAVSTCTDAESRERRGKPAAVVRLEPPGTMTLTLVTELVGTRSEAATAAMYAPRCLLNSSSLSGRVARNTISLTTCAWGGSGGGDGAGVEGELVVGGHVQGAVGGGGGGVVVEGGGGGAVVAGDDEAAGVVVAAAGAGVAARGAL